MTEREMLEIEKYWCENCCNFDKEHCLPDGYANCKLTGTMTFSQECGKDCKCFNIPAENVVVPPCKVGDKVYSLIESTCENIDGVYTVCEFYDEGMCACKTKCPHIYRIAECLVDNGNLLIFAAKWGKTVFLTKEEAETALSKPQSSKEMP